MKKLTGILIAAALILAPMSVSALEMMTDSNMKNVTGQAGVEIAVDDVVLFSDIGWTKYTDTDGAAFDANTTQDGASVMLSDRTSLQIINAVAPGHGNGAAASIGDRFSSFYYATDGVYTTSGGDLLAPVTLDATGKPISIDVGTTTLISSTRGIDLTTTPNQGVNGVIIGLPTVEINTSSESYKVGVVSTDHTGDTMPEENTLIQIENSESTTAILDGYVEIAPH